jgi:hypothetical protein
MASAEEVKYVDVSGVTSRDSTGWECGLLRYMRCHVGKMVLQVALEELGVDGSN